MEKIIFHSPILLLTLIFLTVTQGQYYDVFDSLQQYFQPYRPPADSFSPYNDVNRFTGTRRQPIREENRRRNEDDDGYPNRSPLYDNTFTTSTPKPSRKTTKSPSSQINKQSNIRNFNTDTIFGNVYAPNSEITTKRNVISTNRRIKTTTDTTVNYYYDINKGTTKNIFTTNNYNNGGPNNDYRPVTDNVFENKSKKPNNLESQNNSQLNNQRNDNSNNNFNKENRNYNTQNANNKKDNRFNNNEYNRGGNNNFQQAVNHRNPDVHAINIPNKPSQDNINNNFGSTYNNQNNNNNFNRGGPNNRITPNFGGFNNNRRHFNTDDDGEASEDNDKYNPLLNRPGVKPVPVDVNQPPITNKPVTSRPFDEGFASNTQKPFDSPDILIGSEDDDFSEAQKRKFMDKLEKMCDSYKSLHQKEIVALPLLPAPDPLQLNVSSCVPNSTPLIIGGKTATINEFPHMALVGWKKIRGSGYSWKCGGSLITNQYVLTAGHCTYQDKDYEVDSGPPQAVQLGSSYLDDPDALVMKISAVVRHPKYKQRRSYYDIALIKLVNTVKFSEVIRPACLGVPPSVGQRVIATGWGRTESGGDHSADMRSVSLPVWNMVECREIWGTSLKLPNGPSPASQMCAGVKSGGKDTCQGDSGGPAQIQDGCVWRVVAVTSYGRSCGAPNTPALYAITQRVFIAAQIFGDDEKNVGNDERPSFEDRRQPTLNNRQPGFHNSREPIYTVHNFKK